MPRGLALFLKILLGVGLLLLVIFNGLVDQSVIKDDPVARIWLLSVTAVIIFVDSLWTAIASFRKKGKDQRRDDIRLALLPVLRQIARTKGIDITMLGASTFEVKRRWIFLKRLKRVDRYRMSDLPQPSKVAWLSDKGAIGRAWSRSAITHVDWRPIQARWGAGKLKNETDWESVPEEDRWGMTFEEFRNIVDKYAEILAIPMLKAGTANCTGVLAIDVPIRANAGSNVLDDDEIVEKATEAAGVIHNVL